MKVLTYVHEPTQKNSQAKRIGNRPPFSRTVRKNIQEKADQQATDTTSRDLAQSLFEQRCRNDLAVPLLPYTKRVDVKTE